MTISRQTLVDLLQRAREQLQYGANCLEGEAGPRAAEPLEDTSRECEDMAQRLAQGEDVR